MEDFNSYLRSSKLMALNLQNIKDRIKAVLWIEKLQDPSCGSLRQRHTYLKMLNVALEQHQLFPPFNLKPSNCCKLFVLPNEILNNISSVKGVEWFINFHKFYMSRKKNYLNRNMHSEYVVIEDYPVCSNLLEANTKTIQTEIRVRGGGFPDKNITENLKDTDNSDKITNTVKIVKICSTLSGLIVRNRAGSNPKKNHKTNTKRTNNRSRNSSRVRTEKAIECGKVDEGTDTVSLADYCTPKRHHSFDPNQNSCPGRSARSRGVAEMKQFSTPVYEPIPTPAIPDTPAYTVLPDLSGPMILAYDQLQSSPQLYRNVIYQPLANPVSTLTNYGSEQRSRFDRQYYTNPELSSHTLSSRSGFYSSPYVQQPVHVPVYSPPRTIPMQILNDPNTSAAGTRYRSANMPMPRPIIKQDSPPYYSAGPIFDRTQSPYRSPPQQSYYSGTSCPEGQKTYVVSGPRAEIANPMTRYEEFLQVPRQQQFDRTYYHRPQMSQNNRPSSSRSQTWFNLPSHDPPLHESTNYSLSTYPNISQLSDSVFVRTSPPNTTYSISGPETSAAFTSLSSNHLPRSPTNIPSNYDAFVIDDSIVTSTPEPQPREIATRGVRLGDTYPVDNNVRLEELTKSSGCGKDKSCQKCKTLDSGCLCKCPCEQSFKDRSPDFTGILNANCPEGCDVDINTDKCLAATSKQNSSFRDRVVAQQVDFYKDSVRICDNVENCSGSSKKCREDIICRFASGGLIKQTPCREMDFKNEFVDKPLNVKSEEKRREMTQSNSNVFDIVSLTELNKFHRPLILIRTAKDEIEYIPCIRITKTSDGPNVERWRTVPMKILERISNDLTYNFTKDQSTNVSGSDAENEPIKLNKTTS